MGFQAAMVRSGSRGEQLIIAWITPSDATNLALKTSSALAQGAKHFFYWTYGPTATSTENYWSDLRGEYDGIVRMTRQLASAEHIIAPGVPRKTRVALLHSISADLWQPWGYIHMLERRATYLALGHDQYRVDRSVNWIDYFDRIRLDRTALLGEPVAFGVLGVQIAFTPTSSQVIGRFRGNAPAAVMHDFGRGKAVYVGACPGLSYLKDAGFVPTELKERYPPVQRRVLTGLAAARRGAPPLAPSVPVGPGRAGPRPPRGGPRLPHF